MSCAAQQQQPLVPESVSSAAGALCGCDRVRYRGAATCRSFAPSCRTAPPKLTQARGSPGSRHAPSAWSSLACEDELAWLHPVLNVPQDRSCHEKGRSPRVNVMVRDGTAGNGMAPLSMGRQGGSVGACGLARIGCGSPEVRFRRSAMTMLNRN